MQTFVVFNHQIQFGIVGINRKTCSGISFKEVKTMLT